MERRSFMMRIRSGREMEYERRHDEIWPEMVEALQRSGFRNYTLFREGLRVIGYAEHEPDVFTALQAMSSEPINQKWQESFADILETDASGNVDVVDLTEVWHLP